MKHYVHLGIKLGHTGSRASRMDGLCVALFSSIEGVGVVGKSHSLNQTGYNVSLSHSFFIFFFATPRSRIAMLYNSI